MIARLLALFSRKTTQTEVALDHLVQKVRAKVVSDADIVFVSLKNASMAEMKTAKNTLTAAAPGIKFIVHDEQVKVSAVIKQLEAKVKATVKRAKR